MSHMNHYTYTGEAIPRISRDQNPAFVLHFQKSVLRSLVARKLLTNTQYEQCVEVLSRPYRIRKEGRHEPL